MLSEVMFYLSWLSPLVLIFGIFGAVKNRKTLNSMDRITALFLMLFLTIDLCSRFIVKWLEFESNLLILSFYVIIEFLFLSILYNRFFPTKKSKMLLYTTILGGLIILLFLVSKLAPIIPLKFQMYEGLLANLFSLFFGLFFIYKLMVDEVETSKQYRTLNAIIIMYAGIQLFMALTINFMVNMEVELVFLFWLVRLIALTTFYLKLSHILWQPGKRTML